MTNFSLAIVNFMAICSLASALSPSDEAKVGPGVREKIEEVASAGSEKGPAEANVVITLEKKYEGTCAELYPETDIYYEYSFGACAGNIQTAGELDDIASNSLTSYIELDELDEMFAGSTFLPVEVPIDRVFDIQWNPPGHPQLSSDLLDIPFGDRGSDHRTGHYTFRQSTDGDDNLSLVRVENDGSYVQVFERVQFLLMSDDVLMFNGDPHEDDGWPVGGGFGTIIKAPSIPSGDAPGIYDTEPLDENGMSTAKEWLLKNFGMEEPSLNVTLPSHVGNEGNDIVHNEDGFLVPPLPNDNDSDLHPGSIYSGPCAVTGGLGAGAIAFITIIAVAAVAAIVVAVVVVKCRRHTQNQSDSPNKSYVEKALEEGSVDNTCKDTESLGNV